MLNKLADNSPCSYINQKKSLEHTFFDKYKIWKGS